MRQCVYYILARRHPHGDGGPRYADEQPTGDVTLLTRSAGLLVIYTAWSGVAS